MRSILRLGGRQIFQCLPSVMLVWRLHGAFNQYCITKNSNHHHHHHQGVARGGGGALLWRLTLVNAQWSWEEDREFQVCESLRWNWRISSVFFLDLTFYETSYNRLLLSRRVFHDRKTKHAPCPPFPILQKIPSNDLKTAENYEDTIAMINRAAAVLRGDQVGSSPIRVVIAVGRSGAFNGSQWESSHLNNVRQAQLYQDVQRGAGIAWQRANPSLTLM